MMCSERELVPFIQGVAGSARAERNRYFTSSIAADFSLDKARTGATAPSDLPNMLECSVSKDLMMSMTEALQIYLTCLNVMSADIL